MPFSTNDIKQLSSHVHLALGATNCGIVEGEDGIYLIDTGTIAADGKALLAEAERLHPNKKIIAILNTHAHEDHAGGDEAVKEISGCEIWCSNSDKKILAFPSVIGYMYWGGLPPAVMERTGLAHKNEIPVDKTIDDEQTIDLGLVEIKCVFLPGHFFDQCGFIVKDKKDNITSFFLGDAFFGSSMLKKYWIPFMLDPDAFRKSVEKILSIECDHYIPSHGPECNRKNAEAMAELNIIVTLETETLILKLLKEKPRATETILSDIAAYAGLNMKITQYILIGCTLRSYLSSMEKRGLVTYEIRDNVLLWKPSAQQNS